MGACTSSRGPGRSRATAVAGIVAALIVAGCGSDAGGTPTTSSNPATSGSAGSTATGTNVDLSKVDRDATARIGYSGPISSLDPHKATTSTYPTWIYPVYDRLFQVDAKDRVLPMLAKSYEFAGDGKTLTLHLRDDAVFHDGSPVDAAAVKASLERGKTVEASTVAKALGGVSAVRVVDDHTVALALDGAGADLVAVLASNAGAVLNPKVLADPSTNLTTAPPVGAGSGPYVVTHSEPGVTTSYQRSPQYWDPAKGLMKGFDIKVVSQEGTRIAGLQAGDFDMIRIGANGVEEARAAANAGKFTMVDVPGGSQDLMFNTDSGDLADLDVRKAVALGINRDEIRQLVPSREITQPQREGTWAYDPDIKNVFDPAQAKALMDARGGAKFEISYAAGSPAEQIATVVQAQLKKVGIDVTLRGLEQLQVLPSLASGATQSAINTLQPGVDPNEPLKNYFFGGPNIARGRAKDELTAIAGPGTDPRLTQAQRAEIYKQAFRYIADNYLYIPIYEQIGAYAYAKRPGFVGIDAMPYANRATPDLTGIGVLAP